MTKHDNDTASSRAVLLAGATGLIGSVLLARLQQDGATVIAPTRRPLPAREGLYNPLLPLAPGIDWPVTPQVFLCALGSTIRAAGSRAAFRAVDVDLVLSLAQRARDAGARQAIVVSSIGADPRASSFYLRCKGEMESGLAALGFARLDLLQPSLLLGARAERRIGEAVGQVVLPVLAPLLQGRLAAYRPIAGEAVAAHMLSLLGARHEGVYRHRRSVDNWLAVAG